MAQVDRTMQILSGDYLNLIRAIGQDKTRRLKPLLYIQTFVPLSVGAQARAFADSKIKGVKSPDFSSYPVQFLSIFPLNAAEKSAWVQWALKAVDISTKNCSHSNIKDER
ncbi:hypothetical protein [Microcoleus sp. AT3-D2]|uniref:hypothetical protein n=1 Tax=Microcoleus sp. AT3-D2 TaxID=2818612 RepID=UPI002FD1A100